MKKTIISLVAIAVLVPNISFAQVSAETENTLLRQIVSLLTQQVQLLQTQIELLTTERNTVRAELNQLKAANDSNTAYVEEQKQIEAEEDAEKQAEEDARQEKLDAIEKYGYYIQCNEEQNVCFKYTSEFCWEESINGGPYKGKSCGG